jgi:hypothetical protein
MLQKLIVAVAILLCSFSAKADLVLNGGFQQQVGTNPWTSTAYGISWGDGNFGAAFSYFPGTWSQTISTVPDASYTFAFLLMHDSPGGTQNIAPYYPATQVLQASWNGNVIFTAPTGNFATGTSYESSPSSNGYTWANYEFTVQATGTSTLIAFSGQDTGGYYFLDNVSVNQLSPVPEPESCATLLAGLALLGWVGRRRKQKAA